MHILFDIGKTNMRFAASRDNKELIFEPVKVKVPDRYEEALERMGEVVTKLCGGEEMMVAAGGIGGPLNMEKNALVNIPDEEKRDWVGRPLREDLERVLGGPVLLENDSAMVALGEAHYGAGMGKGIVAYLTVSTGVGGARIVDGAIDRNAFGFEPGHQIIDMDHTTCPSCKSRTLEDHVSGNATAARFQKAPYEVEEREAWDEIAQWLACGVANTIVHWSPDIVVLGGSMVVKKPGIYVEDVQKHLESILTIFPKEQHPPVVEATCGDYGGVWGAMAYIQRHIRRN